MKKFILALSAVASLYADTPPCINPISTVDWVFYADALQFKGVCNCVRDGHIKIGLKWQVAEPFAFVEVVRKAWEFKCLGQSTSKAEVSKQDGNNKSKRGANPNVHYIKYPVFAVLNLAMDNLCVTKKGEKDDFDKVVDGLDFIPNGFSEINPLLKDDFLANLAQPYKILTATPPAQIACLGSCAASSMPASAIEYMEPLRNSLYWCAGCWGALGVNTTSVSGKDPVVESGLIAARMIDMLHYDLQLNVYKEIDGLNWASSMSNFGVPSDVKCSPKKFPVIPISQYWMQLAYPVVRDAVPLGDFPPKWSWFAQHSGGEDFVWAIWRIRTCCVGFQFP